MTLYTIIILVSRLFQIRAFGRLPSMSLLAESAMDVVGARNHNISSHPSLHNFFEQN